MHIHDRVCCVGVNVIRANIPLNLIPSWLELYGAATTARPQRVLHILKSDTGSTDKRYALGHALTCAFALTPGVVYAFARLLCAPTSSSSNVRPDLRFQ